jgi:hypothetical protein
MNFTIDLGLSLTNSTSFGEYLFLQGIISKIPRETHMSDLHREKQAYV